MMVKWNSSCSGREPHLWDGTIHTMAAFSSPAVCKQSQTQPEIAEMCSLPHGLLGAIMMTRLALSLPLPSGLPSLLHTMAPYFLSSAVSGQLDYVF